MNEPMKMPYQAALLFRLLSGVEKLDRSELDKVKRFVLSARCDDGGFRGRPSESSSDLYYTSFALRCLLLTNTRYDAGALFRQYPMPMLTPAELFACTFCFSLQNESDAEPDQRGENRNRLLRQWTSFRRSDGCYASSENTSYSSTYMTFLAASAFEMLGAEEERSSIAVEPILDRQRSDGGFVELAPLRRSGTNPTAAAVALLKMYGREPKNKGGAVEFLLARQTPEGGFQANTQIPGADLLSSFTALVALIDLQAEERCDLDGLRRFVESLKSPEGGWFGAAWDRQCDVEYTFYGLALTGLVAS